MKAITLQLQTIYADLLQGIEDDQPRPGSISRRRIDGMVHIYSVERNGATRVQRYVGPEHKPETVAEVEAVRRATTKAAARRSSIAALKGAGVPSPGFEMGRLLEVLANAGLFRAGAVLVGTAAYQLYPCMVGAHLAASTVRTQDADIGITEIAVRAAPGKMSLEAVLREADPSYRPKFHRASKLPFAFEADNGFSVDVLTTSRRSAGPVALKRLGCAAQPLRFLEYLLEEPAWAVSLFGNGALVRVPDPARFAVHKLIVANVRPAGAAKRLKDLAQAEQLIEAYRMSRALDRIADALADARRRGPKWRNAVSRGLEQIKRSEM